MACFGLGGRGVPDLLQEVTVARSIFIRAGGDDCLDRGLHRRRAVRSSAARLFFALRTRVAHQPPFPPLHQDAREQIFSCILMVSGAK
jgi:hypothetical protein